MTKTRLFFINSKPSEWLTSGRWASTNKVNKRYVYYSLIDDGVSLVVEVGENYIRQSAGTVQAILDLLWTNECRGLWYINHAVTLRHWPHMFAQKVPGVEG